MVIANLGGIELFATSEQENLNNKVTDKPIESGANISDHLEQEPITLDISFIVTSQGVEVANQLRKIRNNKQVYTYTGENKTYENMAVKSLSIPNNSNIQDGFAGSLSLQQVQIIERQTTEVTLGVDSQTSQQVTADNSETTEIQLTEEELAQNNIYAANLIAYAESLESDDNA